MCATTAVLGYWSMMVMVVHRCHIWAGLWLLPSFGNLHGTSGSVQPSPHGESVHVNPNSGSLDPVSEGHGVFSTFERQPRPLEITCDVLGVL